MPYGTEPIPLEHSFSPNTTDSPLPFGERVAASATAGLLGFKAQLDVHYASKYGDNTDMVEPDDLKKSYGITSPLAMSRTSAMEFADAKEAKMKEQAAYRGASGLGGLSSQIVGGLADPTNLAVVTMPEIGVTKAIATKLGGGFLARTAARTAVGGTEAAIANIPAIGAHAALDETLGQQYGGNDFLRDLGLSFGMGTFAHPVIGAFGEAYKAIRNAPLTDRTAALQSTLGSALRDEPHSASSVFQAGALGRTVEMTKPEMTAKLWDAKTPEEFKAALDDMKVGTLSPQAEARISKLYEVRAKLSSARTESDAFGAALDQVHKDMLAPLSDADRIGLVDSASGDRLRAIDSELDGTIPKARREALMDERRMVMEGSQFDTNPALDERAATLEERQNAMQAQMDQQSKRAARYYDEAQKRLDTLVASMKAFREEGVLQGSTQEEVRQYHTIQNNAVSELKEKPQPMVEDLQKLNQEYEAKYADHENDAGFQEAQALKGEGELFETAARAGSVCLGKR